jgi:hypothetical protein
MKQPDYVRRVVPGTLDAYYPYRVRANLGEDWFKPNAFLPPDLWCFEQFGESAVMAAMPTHIDIRKAWLRWNGRYYFADERHAVGFRLACG